MKIKSIYCITATLVFILGYGCSKDYLDEKPPHIIASESLFTDLAGFEAGLNGLYSLARAERREYEGCEFIFNGTDNICSNYPQNYLYQDWGGLNNPEDADFKWLFEWLYSTINSANTIINRAENEDIDWSGKGIAPGDNKNRVIAEARALRGLSYRHLTYGWGDVPMVFKEAVGSEIKTDWERSPVAEIRKLIISDLKFAQEHIPVEGSLRGRLTKGAVQHYLAEMYLLMNKPDSALFWTNQVIDNPAYKLITERYGVNKSEPGIPFMDMFIEGNQNREEGNTEALWVTQFELGAIGGEGTRIRRIHGGRYNTWQIGAVKPWRITYERGGRGKAFCSMTKWAIDAYEPQDDRASNFAIRKYFILKTEEENAPYGADTPPEGYNFGDTIWLNWDNDLTKENNLRADWPWSRKVEGTNPNDVTVSDNYNDQIYLRLADTYLLKAEAQLKLGFPGDAATTINIIRSRSNASPVSGADIDIDFILDERSRELVMEEHRRFTLLRTNKWVERTRKYNKNGGDVIQLRDTIFPIPQSVIDANLTSPMTQNPGF